MTLAQIERIVLQLIGYDRYSSLSVDTNAEKIEDFANLHTCINLAREEIKLNTTIPSIEMWNSIVSVAGTQQYSLPTDFDIPIAVIYSDSVSLQGAELKQIYPKTVIQEVGTAISLLAQGTPDKYIIVGETAGLVQIALVPTPATAGVVILCYKPILTLFTASTNEDTLMKKYPKAVINFATAFAFEIIKKDQKRADEYYFKGIANCRDIDLREAKADSSYKELPPPSIRDARSKRLSR